MGTPILLLCWVFLFYQPIPISDSKALYFGPFRLNINPITVSFLGAYVFSLQVLYKRYVTNDLKPARFINIAMRTLTQMASKLVKRAKFESFDERLPQSLLDGMNIDTELR